MELALGIEPDIIRAIREVIRPGADRAGAGLEAPQVARKTEPANARVFAGNHGAGYRLLINIDRQSIGAIYAGLAVIGAYQQRRDARRLRVRTAGCNIGG